VSHHGTRNTPGGLFQSQVAQKPVQILQEAVAGMP